MSPKQRFAAMLCVPVIFFDYPPAEAYYAATQPNRTILARLNAVRLTGLDPQRSSER
jgi:hypothetical protein